MQSLLRHWILATLVSLALIGIVSCGSDSHNEASLTANTDYGQLTVRVTDAPVDDVVHIFVKFDGLEVKPAMGPAVRYDLSGIERMDLAMLTGGESAMLMSGISLPAGNYPWMRLDVRTIAEAQDPATVDFVAEGYSYAVVGGVAVPLVIPSSHRTGLKLNRPFTVPAGGAADFTLDFDMRSSLHYAPGGDKYMLRPTIRMIDSVEVGQIAGEITGIPEAMACTDGTVYVFEGNGVTPDDLDGTAPDPITSAKAMEQMDGTCHYRAAFLPAGFYTVAFTWDGAADDPATDDPGVTFPFVADAEVAVREVTPLPISFP